MAIKGSLLEASLPDVMQLLFLGRRTGRLAMTDRQSHGSVFFDEGLVVHATIVNRRDRLGDILVRTGRVTPDQLDTAMRFQANVPNLRLGEILVSLGMLSRSEMERHVRIQVEEAIFALFTWQSGSFSFEAGVRPEEDEVLCRINPESVLLEGARRVDEWTLIEKKIPSFDLIFDLEHQPDADLEFSETQRLLLDHLDGHRDVRSLIEESSLSDFDTCKALFGLLTAGIIRRVGTSTPAPQVRHQETQIEEHRNLGVAFYRTGMLDEAMREFRRVADLRPSEGSAPFFLGLIALRQERWKDAAEAFRMTLDRAGPRASALHNLGLALEYLGEYDEAEQVMAEAVARGRDEPRILVTWGIVALARRDFVAAEARLNRARVLYGEASISPVLAWALGRAYVMQGDVERARELVDLGLKAVPGHSALRTLRAVLLEASGDLKGAEEELTEAIAEAPGVPQIAKNLGDICYRTGRYEEAEEWYQRAAKASPELGDDLYFKLGNLALKRDDPEVARDRWEKTVALNPDHQLARANLESLGELG